MDRYWLITWTCYGTWLHGDVRGFVGNIRDRDGDYVVHNVPGTPYDSDIAALRSVVRQRMTGEPVSLVQADADAMIRQYQETAHVRGWALQAASVMADHTHVVVAVPGDPEPDAILETFKSWATRAVRKHRPLPGNGTFWTAKGSKRKLGDDGAVRTAVIYVVKKQAGPLAVWWAPEWESALEEYERGRGRR